MSETQSQMLGSFGEKVAAKFLRKNGYKIIERNYTNKIGEVDLIALYGNLLVLIEVKTRSNIIYGNPADAVDYNKQRKYVLMADVIEVLNGEINHIESAFFADDVGKKL